MSSRGETSNKEGQAESSLMLRAMQQQFERMDVMFNEIRDRMIGKMPLLLVGARDVLREALMLEGKQGVHPWMILMVTTRMSSKVKRIKLH
jgi:hypothetical protein